MLENSNIAQVEKYRTLYPIYENFSQKLRSLLVDIMDASQIKYQVIESRAKEISSFAEKIERPGKLYQDPINEITDLCGCRIIVYYIDDVEKVSDIIKKEFFTKEENLSRQPDRLDSDRFGYLSAHYIVKINSGRSQLIEWSTFISFTAEIQIRTVIQHAWSAVSHALQYKQETSVPSKLQRRLFRIAGLFELADDEFVAIRNIRSNNKEEIKREIDAGLNVLLSLASIEEFLDKWDGHEALEISCAEAGFQYVNNSDNATIVSIYNLCKLGNLSNIESLSRALTIDYFSFLKTVRSLSDTGWAVNRTFAVFLILILFNEKIIKKNLLMSEGCDKEIAEIIMKALAYNRRTQP